jgi:hypothetical protein
LDGFWLPAIANDSYTRAYSFVIDEDMSVQDFITSSSLAGLFHLPISPESMEELTELQEITSYVTFTQQHDTWNYAWDTNKYTAIQYYKFRFRNVVPHIIFSWLWKCKCTPKMIFLAS